MDFNLNIRLNQLENLQQFISSSRDKVESILNGLKWTAKEVLRDSHLTRCPVNSNHRIHNKNADHIQACELKSQGYNVNDKFLSDPITTNTNSSILIDCSKKIEIFTTAHQHNQGFKTAWNGKDSDPKTSDRYTSTYSPDERLALYDYMVQNATGPSELPEFNTVQLQKPVDKSLTEEEVQMQRRDAKRRRIKYKSVHTNRKSHKEILKEVIDGQMELYKDWLIDSGLTSIKEKDDDNVQKEEVQINSEQKSSHSSITDYSERDHSVVSRNSTLSGSSRGQKHNEDRYEHNHRKRYHDSNGSKHCEDKTHDFKKRRSRDRDDYDKRSSTHTSRHERSHRHRHDHYKHR